MCREVTDILPPDASLEGIVGLAGEGIECDVLVIGGGPAGSTAASVLAERGWNVQLVEKARHPRFHIGESLLPMNLPILERLGVLDEVRQIGVVKPGAEFGNERVDVPSQRFDFSFSMNGSPPTAFQVRRAEFDHLLLRNAARKGASVHEGCRVTQVELSAKRQSATVSLEDGTTRQFHSRFVIDASGRDALLSSRLGLKRNISRHRSAALFGHFENVDASDAVRDGCIAIYRFAEGWFWVIPLGRDCISVGAVCSPEYLAARGKTPPADYLWQTIAQCPGLAQRMRDARLCSPVTATGNYSYDSARMHGPGYLLVGDAFTFVDPVFSSGVFLAMVGGERGAAVIDHSLRTGTAPEAALQSLEREMRAGIHHFSWLIYRFNNPALKRLLMADPKPEALERTIISVLAGDVFDNRRIRRPYRVFKLLFYVFDFGNRLRALFTLRRARMLTTET